jgi:hypothetical protein
VVVERHIVSSGRHSTCAALVDTLECWDPIASRVENSYAASMKEEEMRLPRQIELLVVKENLRRQLLDKMILCRRNLV